jgi:hypothetical protein
MNRPQRNHNPGNLRFAGQRESIGSDDGGYARFADDVAGWRALVRQIQLDQKRGDTIIKFIEDYAPKNENHTAAYLKFLCLGLRAQITDKLSDYSPYALAGLIACYEGYFVKDE